MTMSMLQVLESIFKFNYTISTWPHGKQGKEYDLCPASQSKNTKLSPGFNVTNFAIRNIFSWLPIKIRHQKHLHICTFSHEQGGKLTPKKFDRLLFFLLGVGVVLGVEKSWSVSPDCSCNQRPCL